MDINLTKNDIITIKEALSVGADSLIEQAGRCGDDASAEELRNNAREFYVLFHKLNQTGGIYGY